MKQTGYDQKGRERTVSKLVGGEKIFDSRGFSILKITINGQPEYLKLPIRSTDVSEFMDRLAELAPKPPIKRTLIRVESPEGQELGLTQNAYKDVFDLTDEDYVKALNQHNRDFSWQVAIFSLDIDWIKEGGQPAKTFEEKREILRSNKITLHHINQIYKDVTNLTKLQEDREDFLQDGWSA